MSKLEQQQKDCNCELYAYQRVKAAYRQYKAYLMKVSYAKEAKFRAASSRRMAVKFLNAAIRYKKFAMRLQDLSARLAHKASSASSQFAIYESQSKTYLSKF